VPPRIASTLALMANRSVMQLWTAVRRRSRALTASPGDRCTHECQDPPVEAELVARAKAAATSLAGTLDLPVNDAVVVHNSNKLALRLLPCDVFARVALAGHEVSALEVELAQRLAALASPVAALEPRVDPRVYEGDGFALTLWTYYETVTLDQATPAAYADALQCLHAGMRNIEIATPHFMERAAEAVQLVASRDETPALSDADRLLLLSALHGARQQIHSRGAAEQLLHGEPHPGNLLSTQDGPLFIDFESCCRGPIEFDVAHLPEEVSANYPDVDQVLLDECRRLVLAMVAAWRWDVRDEFPDGRQHGRDILTLLREGPPWPVLGALAAE
jgi:aminoglycoside phosphotransferase (APT) family kinase protein